MTALLLLCSGYALFREQTPVEAAAEDCDGSVWTGCDLGASAAAPNDLVPADMVVTREHRRGSTGSRAQARDWADPARETTQ